MTDPLSIITLLQWTFLAQWVCYLTASMGLIVTRAWQLTMSAICDMVDWLVTRHRLPMSAPLSETILSRRLRLFGHTAHAGPEMVHSRATNNSSRDWKRRRGRQRSCVPFHRTRHLHLVYFIFYFYIHCVIRIHLYMDIYIYIYLYKYICFFCIFQD